MSFLDEELRKGRLDKGTYDEWMVGVKEIGAAGMMKIYHAIVTGQKTFDELVPRRR